MHENEDVLELHNTQVEMIIIGTLWKNPETFAYDYMDIIQNRDFSDSACRFYHVLLNKYIVEYSTEVTEQKLNMYVTQNSDVLSGYKKYGFYKTIAEFMKYAVNSTDEMKKQVDILKKWSVLRALSKDGYDVSKVLSHPKFDSLTSEQVANLIRGRTDKICNGILSNIDEAVSLFTSPTDLAEQYLDTPDRGYNLPFEFMNTEFLGGCQGDSLMLMGLSNSGKGRLLSYILAHLFACEDLRVGLMSNEMQEQAMKNAIFSVLFNAKKIQNLHGEELHLPQKRFVSGYYKNSDGEIIRRKVDSTGQWGETVEDFKARVYRESAEYRSVLTVLKWFADKQKNGKGDILFKDMTGGYTNELLVRQMRILALAKNCDVISYDTFKTSSDGNISDYADMLTTATKLTELNKFLNKYLILTLQLNNGALERKIEEIDSSNIAVSSYVFQVADTCCVFKHIDKEDYSNYCVRTRTETIALEDNKHYTGIKILKNRRGGKAMFALESNLDLNVWYEVSPSGVMIPKPKRKRNEIWGE